MKPGKVYLVGAGPGDAGLVTVKAKALIESCDVLVYDYLTNPELKTWTKPDCEQLYVGKRPNLHAIPQDEIENILVERAQAGKVVVRLKGGDPFVFGRGGEEACRLKEDGLDFEIVPGVTAAFGSAAYAGIPLTHRELSSSISFLTGHEDPQKHEMHVDFRLFAKTQGTLCIYMGMGHLDYIVGEIIAGGRAAETPVAVVQWATLNKQRSIEATLGTIVEAVKAAELTSPSVVIVGAVASLKEKIDWFEHRPLFGKRVVVTRNQSQSGELRQKLATLGADVLEIPLIDVKAKRKEEDEADVFEELSSYEWILFTSPNGVKYFFEAFYEKFKDLRCLGVMRIACIGQGTAREVEKQRLSVDFIPKTSVAESLAEELMREHNIENLNMLVITGNKNREVLVKKLEEDGRAIVDTFQVYANEPTDLAEHAAAKSFREHGADAITFTSASTVNNFAHQAKNLQIATGASIPDTVSIGPITSDAMKAKGLPIHAEAKSANLDALVDAVVKTLSK